MKFRAYKLTRADGTNCFNNLGTLTYKAGARLSVDAAPASEGVCARGLHVCREVKHLWQYRNSVPFGDLAFWEVEINEGDVIVQDDTKTRVRALRVVRRMDVTEAFGPNGDEVVELISKLPTFPWYKPAADLDEGIVEQLVTQHLYELATYTKDPHAFDHVTLKIVRTAAAWDAARDAACDAAWDAAWAAALDAACAATWDATWDAARAAARAAARDAACDATWDAAWAAARDAAHLISGLPHNPWAPMVELWALGCAPVGVVDGEFIVYVPEVAK